MFKKVFDFFIRFPWLILLCFAITTIFFARQIPKAQLNPDLKSQIPEYMESRLNIDKIEDIFGGTEVVILSLKDENILKKDTLLRIKKLAKEIENLEEVDQVNSPFSIQDIRGENDQLIIEDAILDIPQNKEEMQKLKKRIEANDLVYGNVISKDFKAVAIVAILKEDFKDKKVLNEIREVIESIPGNEEVYLAGLPIVRAKTAISMQKDMRRLIPIGLLIMLIFLYFCFKELRGVLLTLLVMIISIVFAVGLMPLYGWKIQMITIILPVILLAITNDYAIHIIARYQQISRLNPAIDKAELIYRVIKELGAPIIAAGLTTIIGLLCLLSHIIVPARRLGILAAVGNGLAILGSLLLIPALLVILPKQDFSKRNNTKKENDIIDKSLLIISDLVTKKSKQVIIFSIIFIVLISLGIPLIKVDTNPVNYFSKDSYVVRSDKIVNDYFGGSTNVSIVAEGDIQDPKIMKKIGELENKLEKHKHIGEVMAISEPMRKMNKALYNNNNEYYKLPETKNQIAQYFMLYSMSADMDKVVDLNYRHSQVTARISSSSTTDVKEVVNYISNYIKEDPNSPFKIVGGFADLLSELVDSVVKGQNISLCLSLTIVAIIVMVLFRSVFAGILSITPLGLAIISLFGLMGYFNIELNMVTSLLSSIMIGVGIDYTIHFLWHYREEKKTMNSVEAVKSTLLTTGKAIVFNALSVIFGFVVLLLSSFVPIRFFGFLILVCISTCLFGALVFLPTICIILEPKFLEKP
jgi:hypothetical protein